MTSEQEKIQRRKMSMDGLIPYYVQHQSGEAVASMLGRKREATSYCGRSCVAEDKEQTRCSFPHLRPPHPPPLLNTHSKTTTPVLLN